MTTPELKDLAELASRNPPLYLFWCYPDEHSPMQTQQLMAWKSMPCTPAGDLVADVTNMTYEEAAAIVVNWRRDSRQ